MYIAFHVKKNILYFVFYLINSVLSATNKIKTFVDNHKSRKGADMRIVVRDNEVRLSCEFACYFCRTS